MCVAEWSRRTGRVLCLCCVVSVSQGGAGCVLLFKQRLSTEQNITYCRFLLNGENELDCCEEKETQDVRITSSLLAF